MKITGVQTLVLNLPMLIDAATPMLGGRARTSIDMLLVRVDTDAGITGWGESFGHRIFPATRAVIDTLIGPMCVGRDPSQIASLNDELQRGLTGAGRSGPAMYAISGLDIALWDIAGKAAGLPLYRLLGGGVSDQQYYTQVLNPYSGEPFALPALQVPAGQVLVLAGKPESITSCSGHGVHVGCPSCLEAVRRRDVRREGGLRGPHGGYSCFRRG